MKYSGIGGQAVMEGVMMRNGSKISVAVRKPDKDIEVKTEEFHSISDRSAFFRAPFVRGIVNFIESLYLGIRSLTFSSSFYEDEDDGKSGTGDKKNEGAEAAVTVVISIAFAVVLFMIVPFALSRLFGGIIKSDGWLTVIEGIIRVAVLIAYMAIISAVDDIHRVYMYHGAEHKCINCIENGLPLTISNVRRQTRRHKRCGTSFLLYVVLLSAVLFMFIRSDNMAIRLILRIVLVPVIASIAYEFIRLAGRYDNKFTRILSEPGMWVQSLTTREPDDSMIEVGIKSVEAVFDVEAFLKTYNEPDNKEKKTVEAKKKKQTTKPVEKPVKAEAGKKAEKARSSEETVPVIKKRVRTEMPEPVSNSAFESEAEEAAKKRKEAASRVKPEIPSEKAPVTESTEDDDEILNALDRFFNNERAIENAKRKENDKTGRLGKK